MDPQMFEMMKSMHTQIKGIQGELLANQARPNIQPVRTLLPAQGVAPRDGGSSQQQAHAITSIFGIEGDDPIVRVMKLVENGARDSFESKGGDDFIVEDEPYEDEANHEKFEKSWLPSSHELVLERIDGLGDSLAKLEIDEGLVTVKRVEKEALGQSLAMDQSPKLKVTPRVYTPPLPFPQRARQSRKDNEHAKFVDTTKKNEVWIPSSKAMTKMSNHAKPPKNILELERSIEAHEFTSPIIGCGTISMNKVPRKLMDPGSFSIPCMIGDLKIEGALCDSGASVNILPLPIAKKLGMERLSPTNMKIQLADRSTKHPMGILKDLSVKVGKLFIPTDFLVVDIPEDGHTPIILGRAFMATGGAKINVQEGTISFKVNGEKVKFCMPDTLCNPMIEEKALIVDEVRDVITSKPSCLSDIVSNGETPIFLVNKVEGVTLKGGKKKKKTKNKAKMSQTSRGNETKGKRCEPYNESWEEMTNTMKEVKSFLSMIARKLCACVPQGGGKENERDSCGHREGDPA